VPSQTTRKSRVKRPDDVSDDFPDGAIKLFTKLLNPTPDGEAARLLIEGDKTSLEYLGRMILAQAAFPLDCSYGISPRSAGRAFFKRGSKLGIVIHRLPCLSPGRESAVRRARGSNEV
jgi:hypothetical protein